MPTFTGTAIEKTEIKIEQFWTIRGISVSENKVKQVTCEEELNHAPNEDEIATFIHKHRDSIDFVSVFVNYREVDYLPFEEGLVNAE